MKDVLVLDYWDGSGACGEYSFFASPGLSRIWRNQECADTGSVDLLPGTNP